MKKKEKRPLIVVGEENKVKGQDLIDMGKFLTTDGRLIASTFTYIVIVTSQGWTIQ